MGEPALNIRTMQRADIERMMAWAAAEGWNPGVDDAECFVATDPDGFLVGYLDGEPAGCISVVAYDDRFAFLGFYIVAEGLRGRGYGWQLWTAGLRRLGGRCIGLDGVLAQEANYRRSGFALAHRQIRYAGQITLEPPGDGRLIPLADVPFAQLAAFDRQFFPAPRERFLRCWLHPEKRRGFAIQRDGRLTGYGVIRRSIDGDRIGPLFATGEADADLLFRALAATAPADRPVFIDVPAPNAAGVALARRYGLQPAFETVRMYRGEDPGLPLPHIYGNTTFELG
ncbi:MAG: GNAT family N-acetyltransferase [Rhodospirillales bacterium]